MYILGIDTSTKHFNIAINKDEFTLTEYGLNKKELTHSAIIIPAVKQVLALAGIELTHINGIAVAIGPGSFTGLRIGLATAKGLAYALSVPLADINTLSAYAWKWRKLPGIICPTIKARKEEYYYSFYCWNNQKEQLDQLQSFQCSYWPDIKRKMTQKGESRNFFIVGYGLSDISKDVGQNTPGKNNLYVISEREEAPGAVAIAYLGKRKMLNKKVKDILNIEPFYIRKSAAEINRIKKVSQ